MWDTCSMINIKKCKQCGKEVETIDFSDKPIVCDECRKVKDNPKDIQERKIKGAKL